MKKAKWMYLQRLIFLTGGLALTLGVYQNLPAVDMQRNYMAVVPNVDVEYENMKGKILKYIFSYMSKINSKKN